MENGFINLFYYITLCDNAYKEIHPEYTGEYFYTVKNYFLEISVEEFEPMMMKNIKNYKKGKMLYFFDNPLNSHLSSKDLDDYKNDCIYIKRDDGSERVIYKKSVNLLNESFMIDFVFRDNQLYIFNIESSEVQNVEADTLHQKWLEKNFGQYKRWVGKELHHITNEYDFYSYYDPRSGSAEILCKVLK